MSQQSPSIPKEVEAHYLETKESERLSSAHGELERLRTLEILARALPPAPAVIFDIGGAAGAYAFPLSEQGYVVHLIDPVEIHLEQAKACSAASGRTFRPSALARGLSDYGVTNVGTAGTFVVRKPGSRAKFRTALLRKLPFKAEVPMQRRRK